MRGGEKGKGKSAQADTALARQSENGGECSRQTLARIRILEKEYGPRPGALLKSACSDRKSLTTFAEHAQERGDFKSGGDIG